MAQAALIRMLFISLEIEIQQPVSFNGCGIIEYRNLCPCLLGKVHPTEGSFDTALPMIIALSLLGHRVFASFINIFYGGSNYG